ncbi:LysR family transcriptional regulator [uncultured Clostridium sp.]|uniref:LysR family transcriptional regulator n=1 Tax=uncultured Clostridium sp. TaxID=59620 RepID=UPI0025D2C4AE|nr:LysR family transcriptional regulator [uncultured Clostridium sp.]
MNFVDLQCFLAAAEEMSFTRAAVRLYMSQQALSSHIAKLETYYETKLFDRQPPLTLTETGKALLPYAEKILNQGEEAGKVIQDIRDFRQSGLIIGIPNYTEDLILPALLPAYYKKFPGVHVQVVEQKMSTLKDMLYKGKIDLLFDHGIQDEELVKRKQLFRDSWMIVVPKTIFTEYFSAEEQRELLKSDTQPLSKFKKCPFIRMSGGTTGGDLEERYFQERELELPVVMELSNIQAKVSLSMAGLGVTMCPEVYLQEPRMDRKSRKQLVCFYLDYPEANNYLAVSYLKNKYLSRASRELIAMATELFSERKGEVL